VVGAQVYKRRWAVLLCFCLCNAANALVWITFSPISDQVEAKYDISSTWVRVWRSLFSLSLLRAPHTHTHTHL
jgi:hypothetical protein